VLLQQQPVNNGVAAYAAKKNLVCDLRLILFFYFSGTRHADIYPSEIKEKE
jgi:hypothetical protein